MPEAPVDEDAVHEEDAESPWPEFIEGARCRVEQRPEYTRLIARCTHHRDSARRRNVGADQIATLGPREPVAFLAVWLLSGANCTREEHPRVKPDMAEQRARLEANPR